MCKSKQKDLLCYKSKEEVQKIIDRFFAVSGQATDMRFWLSTQDCSALNQLTECLSLHVARNGTEIWHFFQTSCDHLPFFCCVIGTGQSTTSVETGSTEELTTISDKVELTTPSATVSVTINETTTPFITFSEAERTTTNQTSTETTSSEAEMTTTDQTSTETTGSELLCKSVMKRGVFWPDTPLGSTVTVPCPGDSIGNASWSCTGPNATWAGDNPNMTQCHSLQLKNIKDEFEKNPADATINSLTELFEGSSDVLQGNDLQDAISVMLKLPEKLFRETLTINGTARWEIADEAVTKTASLFNQLMDLDAWSDISADKVPKVGSQMLSAADHFGFFLADAMNDKERHSVINANIAIEVLKEDYGQTVSLPFDLGEHSRRGRVTLNSGYDKSLHPDKGPISVIYIYYANMSNILRAESKGLLNSPVVSTSISQGGLKPVPVKSNVHVLVEHLVADKNNSACVFWNLKRHTWDPTGCRLKGSNATHTLCECDHLTNFAVLMDYKGLLSDEDDTALFYITVIGCSISIVSLAICIAIFTCFRWKRRNAWGVRYSIHRNLCLTLFLANLLLLVGLNRTENHIACAVIAGFLHYLFLAAFCWMLLEGVHIYVLLIIIFSQKETHCMKYYIFGYGFPLLVVAITAALRPDGYGTQESCWLAVDNGTVWSFTGPVACIILVNSAALMLAQIKASKMSTKDDNVDIIKRWLRVTFILFPILGLTWVLGFLFVGRNYKIVAYVFAFLNSLQGFCIFVCHCIMDKNARSMITDCIRRRIASMETESSGSKRSRKDTNRRLIINRGRLSSTSSGQRKWTLWRKPWSFSVKFNLRKVEPSPQSEVATVLQWRILQEMNSL